MKTYRVLVGCEESGTVRDAFARRGWDAWSCDLLPSRSKGQHIQHDVFDAIKLWGPWNLIILHPDCKAMALSGNGTYGYGRKKNNERLSALFWTETLWNTAKAHCAHVALEQPKSSLRQRLGSRTQEIHPYEFGHMEQKTTWLWLHHLPLLVPTNNVYDEMMKLPEKERCKVWYASPGKNRSRDRSVTYAGIAQAMADQWGHYIETH